MLRNSKAKIEQHPSRRCTAEGAVAAPDGIIEDRRRGWPDGLHRLAGHDPQLCNKKHERLTPLKELMTQTTGPVAHALNLVFATDWYLETGEVTRRGRSAARRRRRGSVEPADPAFPTRTTCDSSTR
jgi:phosphatidylserine/phosphatidylglycerophosphate/cardiolipin synthase-like enzyme